MVPPVDGPISVIGAKLLNVSSYGLLIETPGGFDFTGADCIQWMKKAGFKRTKVEKLAGPDSMVIAIK